MSLSFYGSVLYQPYFLMDQCLPDFNNIFFSLVDNKSCPLDFVAWYTTQHAVNRIKRKKKHRKEIARPTITRG